MVRQGLMPERWQEQAALARRRFPPSGWLGQSGPLTFSRQQIACNLLQMATRHRHSDLSDARSPRLRHIDVAPSLDRDATVADDETPTPTAAVRDWSVLATSYNLMNGILGTSFVSLPYAVKEAGSCAICFFF